ncbi:FG-GAP-like repeat-containing protein [Desulfoferrobacter suflitae]|uniref:FG-GAP-like repeat-containing protein n=1 Tax=Desulfoferrobacter suflitae TaxID=2865782 RepID=UPI002164D6B7|nr:FG-GAP-like repeat-containing protein [Desulfoferrobacter suflitae]MCK8600868.1 FG-GAP-like repeat-containing protein [Desulfoferrobacter suflitae]
MRKLPFVKKFFILALVVTFFGAFSPVQSSAQTPVKIAILPFSMHAPADLNYLQDGIRDMLASRLAQQGKVQIIDKAAAQQALKGTKDDLSSAEAASIGRSLGADYVLFGSLTAIGQNVSIDAKMTPLAEKTEPMTLATQTNLDGVIPQINMFAQQINQKVFGRSGEYAQAPAAGEVSPTSNPELLVPDSMIKNDRISYLNPNFIEVTPEDSLHNSGLWRSQTFREGIVGMDVGDLDGDGHQEIVTASYNRVTVHRREGQALRTIASFNGTNMDQFIWVALADTNRDGIDEIYVTKLLRRNDPKGNTSSRVSYGRDVVWIPVSLGLTMTGGKLQVLFSDEPYLLNAVTFPKRGKVLLGQRMGHNVPNALTVQTSKTLDPDVYEMQLKGGKLATAGRASIPSRCNVFNFAVADINNDNSVEYMVVDQDNRFYVLDSAGNQMWKSRQRFAATSNGFSGKVTDISFNQIDYFFLPSPIVVMDLNSDNIPEIVVNRSPDYGRFLPSQLKFYESGEIVSFSWDQMGMVENWKTRELGGMVTSIREGDLNGDGTPELIASLIMAKDFLKLWESKSTIFSYDLNVARPKTAKAQ